MRCVHEKRASSTAVLGRGTWGAQMLANLESLSLLVERFAVFLMRVDLTVLNIKKLWRNPRL